MTVELARGAELMTLRACAADVAREKERGRVPEQPAERHSAGYIEPSEVLSRSQYVGEMAAGIRWTGFVWRSAKVIDVRAERA